jgi:light-regulated signal transduction histidine kinase (bacteriophytochrome)
VAEKGKTKKQLLDENEGLRLRLERAEEALIAVRSGEVEALRMLNEELQQKVAARTAELSSAYKDMENFSSSISHDLRAPLRRIEGFSQILRETYADKIDEEGRKLLDSIGGNVRRMDQLIMALLDLSKVSRQEMQLSDIDMERLARRAFDDLAHTFTGRSVNLDLKALPPARGDLVLIKQVFTNLISNSIKFTARKEAAIIEIGSSREGTEIIYYVRDNGAGFDMHYADKLFVAFQRLHSAKEFEGTGIGLFIVDRIIRRHGGRVWAEGEVGKGAVFYFSLG